MKEKGFAPILVLVGVLILAVVGSGVYYLGIIKNKPFVQNLDVISQASPTSTTQISPSPAAANSINYHKPQNLDFSNKPCSKDISGFDMDKMGIKEVTWKDNTTLSVKAYVTTYCAGATISYPNYKIEKNNLTLEYTIINEDTHAKCMCARELNYTITDLPKEDYNVLLRSKDLL